MRGVAVEPLVLPAGVALASGAVDGLLVKSAATRIGGPLKFGPLSALMTYRLGLLTLGAGLSYFSDVRPEVTLSVMCAGAYGVASSLGARVAGGTLVPAAGAVERVPAADLEHDPHLGCSGCASGPTAPPHPVTVRHGLVTPRAGLTGY